MVKPEEIVVFKLKSWAAQTAPGLVLVGDEWFKTAGSAIEALRGTSVKIIVADFEGVVSCCYVAAKCLLRLKSQIGEYLPKSVLILTNRTSDVQDALRSASMTEGVWIALDSSPFFQEPGGADLVPVVAQVHAAGTNGVTAADLASWTSQTRKNSSASLIRLAGQGVLLRRAEFLHGSGGRCFRYWTPASFLRHS